MNELLKGSEQELNLVGVDPDGVLVPITDITAATSVALTDEKIIILPGKTASGSTTPEKEPQNITFTATSAPRMDPNAVIIITGAVCPAPADMVDSSHKLTTNRKDAERNTVAMYYIEEGSNLLVCNDNKL